MLVRSVFAVALVLATTIATVAEPQQCPGWRDPVEKKIIGGTSASLAMWPSQAALRIKSPAGTDAAFVCGGTAITHDWILTAAHCFDEVQHQPGCRQAWAGGADRGAVIATLITTAKLNDVEP